MDMRSWGGGKTATRVFAGVLSRPTFHHAPWLRVAPLLVELRAEHPPFMALLDQYDPPDGVGTIGENGSRPRAGTCD